MNNNEKHTKHPKQYLHKCPAQQFIYSETVYPLFQSPYTYP